MKATHRDDVIFLAIGILAFVTLAAIGAKIRMELALWYITNCWSPSTTCKAIDFYTDYWVIGFVLAALGFAYLINRSYQARLKARESGSSIEPE